jgi:general secretion pathway protein G
MIAHKNSIPFASIVMLFLLSCTNVPDFEEKYRVEVTDGSQGSWNFKNLGERIELLMEMNSSNGKLVFLGFHAGTAVVAGKDGFSNRMQNERNGFRISIENRFQEGAEVLIREEGKLDKNLSYIKNGKISSVYSVHNPDGEISASGTRFFLFKDGKLKSFSLSEQKGPTKINLENGKYVDVKELTMTIRNESGSPMSKDKQEQARNKIESLSSALKMFALDNGFFPSTEQGLSALVKKPATEKELKRYAKGGYLTKQVVPKDPWGNEYNYYFPGLHSHFDLWSYGKDGKEGGEGENADIVNWK